MLRWAVQQAEQAGAPKVIYVNLDDSIAAKHKECPRKAMLFPLFRQSPITR